MSALWRRAWPEFVLTLLRPEHDVAVDMRPRFTNSTQGLGYLCGLYLLSFPPSALTLRLPRDVREREDSN